MRKSEIYLMFIGLAPIAIGLVPIAIGLAPIQSPIGLESDWPIDWDGANPIGFQSNRIASGPIQSNPIGVIARL